MNILSLKKLVLFGTLLYIPFQSMGWGMLGHRVVGQVAESYLSKKASREVKNILGTESMAMASNWADFIKSEPAYNYLGNWHIGEKPDRRSIAVAQKYGVDITNQSCRQFDITDFEKYDHILTMDQNNLSDVISLANGDDGVEKVRLFLKNGIVPDPYHDDNQFEPVYLMIEKRCKEIITELGSNR